MHPDEATSTHEFGGTSLGERCRRPWLVANSAKVAAPPPRNVADWCELTVMTEQVGMHPDEATDAIVDLALLHSRVIPFITLKPRVE